MVVAQKVKEAEITEQDSLLLTRNLLRIAIFNISYIRGLFPEKYFNDKSVPALEMKIKKLMPMDAESRRLIDWMEKGVYDALQRKYLKALLFCVCEAIDGPMIEEYAFSFSYSNSDSQEVSMNINRTGDKKTGRTIKCNSTEVTSTQMRSSACKMVRTLVQLMRTLDRIPDERTILMKLLYYDDVTPVDYEPPFFKGCTEEEAFNPWIKNPLRMEVGNVNSKHLVLALKVKSVLDPCEDENEDLKDDEMSLGADSVQGEDFSESESEGNKSEEDQYLVAPVDGRRPDEDIAVSDEDETYDEGEDQQQLARIKEWITSHHTDTVELTDVLSNFPDISMVLTEDIMGKLVKEGILSKSGRDLYTIKERKKFDYEFDAVKDETIGQQSPFVGMSPQGMSEDRMYMKALYHALPLNYITISALHNKLDGEANQTTVRKLLDKMAQDGFIEAQTKRRLGKRVIHSDLTRKKLSEVKIALQSELKDANGGTACNKAHQPELHEAVGNQRDISTCGNVQSIGSDVTRTKVNSGLPHDGSIRSERTTSKTGNTPTSGVEPVASRESFVPGKEGSRENGNANHNEEGEMLHGSRSTQDKRSRKASLVKEPIKQFSKRQRSQAP